MQVHNLSRFHIQDARHLPQEIRHIYLHYSTHELPHFLLVALNKLLRMPFYVPLLHFLASVLMAEGVHQCRVLYDSVCIFFVRDYNNLKDIYYSVLNIINQHSLFTSVLGSFNLQQTYTLHCLNSARFVRVCIQFTSSAANPVQNSTTATQKIAMHGSVIIFVTEL